MGEYLYMLSLGGARMKCLNCGKESDSLFCSYACADEDAARGAIEEEVRE